MNVQGAVMSEAMGPLQLKYAELPGTLLQILWHGDLFCFVAEHLKHMSANRLVYIFNACRESRRMLRDMPKEVLSKVFEDKEFIVVMCNQLEHPSRCDERLRRFFEMCAEVHLIVMDRMEMYEWGQAEEATDEFRKMYPEDICSVQKLRVALMQYFLRKPGVHLKVSCADLEVSGSEKPLNKSQLRMLAAEYVRLGRKLERGAIETVKSLRNKPDAVSIGPMYKDLYDVPRECLSDYVQLVRLKERQIIGICCSTSAAVMAFVHDDIALQEWKDTDNQRKYIGFGDTSLIFDDDHFAAFHISMLLLRKLDVFDPPYRLSALSDHLCKALQKKHEKYRNLVELLRNITSVMAPGQRRLADLEGDLRQQFFLGTAPLRPESPERAQKETECKRLLRKIVNEYRKRTDLAADLVQHM